MCVITGRRLRECRETFYAIVAAGSHQHGGPAPAVLHTLPVQEIWQVSLQAGWCPETGGNVWHPQVRALLHAGHQAEPDAGRGLLQPGERVQGARAAAGGPGQLPPRRAPQAGLHRRLHQPGRRPRGRRGHGGGGAGLRLFPAVQPCEFLLMSHLYSVSRPLLYCIWRLCCQGNSMMVIYWCILTQLNFICFQDLYCVRSDLGNLLKALGRLDEAKVGHLFFSLPSLKAETRENVGNIFFSSIIFKDSDMECH